MNPSATSFRPQDNTQNTTPRALPSGDEDPNSLPIFVQRTYPNKSLPIPSPTTYRDIYYPPNLFLQPLLQTPDFPIDGFASLPYPIGTCPISIYNIRGLSLYHDFQVHQNPTKLFTRWQEWYLEINNSLLSKICPADLNDLPCPWDELQGGCSMLRLCALKRKYPHPHLGPYPVCKGAESRKHCVFIHDIEPTCRSLHSQLTRGPHKQFQSVQSCKIVARQADEGQVFSSFCKNGHDLEGARVEAWWNYWEHRVQAMRRGAVGVITEDRLGKRVRISRRPKRQTLKGTSEARDLDGSLTGRTWHGHWVTLTCMVGSDQPVVEGEDMIVDRERGELRPARRLEGTSGGDEEDEDEDEEEETENKTMSACLKGKPRRKTL